MSERRVVVTGVALVNAAGSDARRAHEAIARGELFLRAIPRLADSDARIQVAGEATHVQTPPGDRAAHLTMAATEHALADSGIDLARGDRERIGVAFGHDATARATMEE